MTTIPFRNAARLTRLLYSTALLMGVGILTPIFAEPSLRATEVAQKLQDGDNPGRHLALGHFKQNVSIALPDTGNGAFTNSSLNGHDVRVHGFRDPSVAGVVAAPEPASMLLLSSGLVGAAAAIRKRRRAST